MKHLSEYINEGIFDDNIHSAIKLNGIEIDDKEWELCKKFYAKRRAKYFGDKKTVTLGDLSLDYNVLYNEKDCIIALCDDKSDIYLLSPETIYMCHEASELLGRSRDSFSLTNIDEANDFDIAFNYFFEGLFKNKWGWIGTLYSGRWAEKMKEAGFESLVGYIPSTISPKAQTLLKNLTK